MVSVLRVSQFVSNLCSSVQCNFTVSIFLFLNIKEYSPGDHSRQGSVHSRLLSVPSRSKRKVPEGSGGIWCS